MIEVLRLLTYHYSFGDFPESILCSRWERFIGQNLIYSRKGRQYIQQSDQVLREIKVPQNISIQVEESVYVVSKIPEKILKTTF